MYIVNTQSKGPPQLVVISQRYYEDAQRNFVPQSVEATEILQDEELALIHVEYKYTASAFGIAELEVSIVPNDPPGSQSVAVVIAIFCI